MQRYSFSGMPPNFNPTFLCLMGKKMWKWGLLKVKRWKGEKAFKGERVKKWKGEKAFKGERVKK